MIIGDLVTTVAKLLGGRTDLDAEISTWLANGYQDLTSTVPFETLELTQINQTVQGQDSYSYPGDARAIKALTITVSNQPRRMYKKNIDVIDRYQVGAPAVPIVWAPFANQIVMRPFPNDTYPFIVRYWQTVQIDTTDASTINPTTLLIPNDWVEIVSYEAQMRGYMDLQEPDKAAQIRTLLYGQGDPRKPGLIKQRLTQIQSESMNANYGIRPRVQRLTWVR